MTKHKNKPKPNPQQKKEKFTSMVDACVQNVKERRKSAKTKDADNDAWRKQYVASLRSAPQRST
jgi:hypothetical protein